MIASKAGIIWEARILVAVTELVYAPQQQLALDLYQPAGTPQGLIIDLHGGGWFRGDKRKDADWATVLTDQGFVVVVPNYRLVPVGYYPAPLQDLALLMQWLHNSQWQDLSLGAVGSSAGGNLSVELAVRYGIPAVSLSGILDIDAWLAQHTQVVAAEGDTSQFDQLASEQINQTGANDQFYKWFIMNYFNQRTDQLTAATPVHRVTPQTGPLYLANSLAEFVPVSGVQAFAAAAVEAQVPVETAFLSGSRHGKGYLADVLPATMAFLKRYVH